MKNGQFHQRTRICKDKNENKSLVKILELQNSKSEIQNSIKGFSRLDRRESTLEVENIRTKIQRGKRLKKKYRQEHDIHTEQSERRSNVHINLSPKRREQGRSYKQRCLTGNLTKVTETTSHRLKGPFELQFIYTLQNLQLYLNS